MNIALSLQDLLLLLVPAFIAVIIRPAWSGWAKFLCAVAVCAAAALVEVFLSGGFEAANISATFAKVFALVTTAYAAIWKRFQFSGDFLNYLEKNVNAGTPGALVLALTCGLLFSGCATTPPVPKPECQGAKLANSGYAKGTMAAIEFAWGGVIISESVPKPLLQQIARAGLAAAQDGGVDGLVTVISMAASELSGKNYGVLVLPLLDLFADYGSPRLHSCDQALVVKLFQTLLAMAGG